MLKKQYRSQYFRRGAHENPRVKNGSAQLYKLMEFEIPSVRQHEMQFQCKGNKETSSNINLAKLEPNSLTDDVEAPVRERRSSLRSQFGNKSSQLRNNHSPLLIVETEALWFLFSVWIKWCRVNNLFFQKVINLDQTILFLILIPEVLML